jgi:hypothetical protein
VQPLAEVIKDQAGLAAVLTDQPGLPQRRQVADADLLAPVSGRGREAEFFRRRPRGEQRYVVAVGT